MNPLCKQCGGECCKTIILPLDALRTFDVGWLAVRGMLIEGLNGRMLWRLKARCPHLDRHNRCDIYQHRPRACREYVIDGPMCRLTQRTG